MNYFICSFYNIRIILYLEYKCITFFFVEILLRLDIWIHNSYFLAKRLLKSHETKVRSRKGSPFPILRSDNHERGREGRRVGGGGSEGQDFPTLDATAVPEKVFVPSAPFPIFPPSLPGHISNRTEPFLCHPSLVENKLARPDHRKEK